jgi:hypothetical protein
MKFKKIGFVFAVIFSCGFFSCSSLKDLGYSPEIKMQSVSLKNLDFDGITFDCAYSLSNPYPLSFSIKKIAGTVDCSGSEFAQLSADEGVSMEAKSSRTNSFSFKIPYETILSLAKNFSGKESLPFSFSGSASLDLSKIPLASEESLDLPFSVEFDVPVFKPKFSVSNPRLKTPSLSEMKDAFLNGGLSLVSAAATANHIVSGKSISEAIFDNTNLDFEFLVDLNISGEGNSAWQCILKNCALKTSSAELVNFALGENGTLDESKNSAPLAARLNTISAGKYIAQMLNKKGENPSFAVETALSFPNLNYAKEIPLSYECTIPLSKISRE